MIIPAFYIYVCIYICILYIYMCMCDLSFDKAGGQGRAMSCWLLWFQPLWYVLGSLRIQESYEDGCPEYLFSLAGSKK